LPASPGVKGAIGGRSRLFKYDVVRVSPPEGGEADIFIRVRSSVFICLVLMLQLEHLLPWHQGRLIIYI